MIPLVGLEVDCGCGSVGCKLPSLFAVGVRDDDVRVIIARERDSIWTRGERWDRNRKTRVQAEYLRPMSTGVHFVRLRLENDCYLTFARDHGTRYSRPVADTAILSIVDIERNGRAVRELTVRFTGMTSEGECHIAARPYGAITLRTFFLEGDTDEKQAIQQGSSSSGAQGRVGRD